MTHYLLSANAKYGEQVCQYTDAEMAEIFTPDQRAALARGEGAVLSNKYAGATEYRDMVACTRAAF